jgi:hypothetical protein
MKVAVSATGKKVNFLTIHACVAAFAPQSGAMRRQPKRPHYGVEARTEERRSHYAIRNGTLGMGISLWLRKRLVVEPLVVWQTSSAMGTSNQGRGN